MSHLISLGLFISFVYLLCVYFWLLIFRRSLAKLRAGGDWQIPSHNVFMILIFLFLDFIFIFNYVYVSETPWSQEFWHLWAPWSGCWEPKLRASPRAEYILTAKCFSCSSCSLMFILLSQNFNSFKDVFDTYFLKFFSFFFLWKDPNNLYFIIRTT